MKKINLLILLCVGIVTIGFTQDSNIEVGEPYDMIPAKTQYYFAEEEQIMGVKVYGNDVFIQKWSSSSKKEVSRVEHRDLRKSLRAENVLKIQGHYYFFFSIWDGENRTVNLYSWEIDFELGEFIGQENLLFQVEGVISHAFSEGTMLAKLPKFNIQLSPNESVFLVQYRKNPNRGFSDASPLLIGISTFNSANMNLISAREVEMPYKLRKMKNIDYIVDENAAVYLLAKVIKDESRDLRYHSGKTNYLNELIHIDLNSERPCEIVLFEKNIYITSVKQVVQSNGDILYVSAYTDNIDDVESAIGCIVFKIDGDYNAVLINQFKFTPECLTISTNFKKAKKNIPAIREEQSMITDLVINDAIKYKDGSMLIIAEQNAVNSDKEKKISLTVEARYHYEYNDIIITKLDKHGEVLWMKRLIKKQKGGGITLKSMKESLSYKYYESLNTHYLLFLDNLKSMDYNSDETAITYSYGDAVLTAFKVDDQTGSFEKVYLLNTTDVKGKSIEKCHLESVTHVANDNFIFEGYKGGKEDILIKLKP